MSRHQYAMVMDLNKCIGCQTCTLACKKQWTDGDGMDYMYWNNVETHPGIGYPRGWHTLGGGFDEKRKLRPSKLPDKADYGETLEYDYGQRLFQGKGKPVMPHTDPSYTPNWDEDVGGWDQDNPYFFYLPRICNHCTHPACLEACPRKAIYKREEDGIVLIDQERCRGYRYCVKACPYKKIYYNEVLGRSEKCIFCYPRLEKGRVNACASQCPGRIRFVGLLDDPQSPVHKLVLEHEVALGLFPEKGTSPNVYYVPPFQPPKAGHAGRSILEDPRLPLDYLKYLLGPRVVDVIERLEEELSLAQSGGRSEVLQLLIGRDENVRYRLASRDEMGEAPAGVEQQIEAHEPGPDLTLMGSAHASPPSPPPEARRKGDHSSRVSPPEKGASDGRPPESVRQAFGLAALGGLAVDGEPAPGSGCDGCSLAPDCASRSDSVPREDDHDWF